MCLINYVDNNKSTTYFNVGLVSRIQADDATIYVRLHILDSNMLTFLEWQGRFFIPCLDQYGLTKAFQLNFSPDTVRRFFNWRDLM